MELKEIIKDLEHTIKYFKQPETQVQVGRKYQAEKTLSQLLLYGVLKSLPTEMDEFLNYIKETCIKDCDDWHSLLHNKKYESNDDLYKQYLKDKRTIKKHN